MGIPSPGETALVLAAVLASQGKLNIELVILIGAASAIVGDNLGYFLGRRAPPWQGGPMGRPTIFEFAGGDQAFLALATAHHETACQRYGSGSDAGRW